MWWHYAGSFLTGLKGQLFVWRWQDDISNLETFVACTKQIVRSHPKLLNAVKQLLVWNQELKAQRFEQNLELNTLFVKQNEAFRSQLNTSEMDRLWVQADANQAQSFSNQAEAYANQADKIILNLTDQNAELKDVAEEK